MRVIGYHITHNFACNSDSESCTEAPWLDFLFAEKGECIKVLYHMDYSVACLLKMLNIPADALKELAETTDLNYEEYTFQYIPKKWFSIKDKKTRQWAGFSDMAQYENCNLQILEGADNAKFCASAAKVIGDRVYITLVDLGLSPKSLASPISAFNREILSAMDLPTVDDIPDEVAEYAYQCCRGSWIENFAIGNYDDTLDWDIKSAYGAELAKLVDFRLGGWEQSKMYIANARYGFCKGVVTINKSFSPILFKTPSNLFTPMGTWETYLTKDEIDFIDKWGLGEFEIENGFWFTLDKENYKEPLRNMVAGLFRQKGKSTGRGNRKGRLKDGIIPVSVQSP